MKSRGKTLKKEITDGGWMEEIACVENEYYVVKYT
jgi:hypothetical protein